MAEQPGRGTPKLARTDFESMTHEQLAALLDSASSESASHLATKLSKASSTITGIGDDLMTYVKGLEWQGEGGDAFRNWGGQSAAATLRLGQYAEVASRWMATVAQAVAEAKAAMPATSETTQAKADLADARKTLAAAQDPGARNDPDARKLAQTAQSDATAAQQRMEAARAEAIQQLRKLAQTYEYSAQQVNSVPPPTFAPPADHLPPGEWRSPEQYIAPGVGGSGATTAANPGPAVSGERSEASNPTRPTTTAGSPPLTSLSGREPTAPPPPAAMSIDGVTSPPDARNGPLLNTTGPQGGPGPRPDSSHAVQPVVVQPVMNGHGRLPGPLGPPQAPQQVRPSPLPGQTSGSGSVPRLPRETGIIGGRPVTPTVGRPPTGLPRGTVIGGDSGQGRMPLGRAASPGIPMGAAPVTGQSAAQGSRRLASETGGVVGRGPAQPGRTGPRSFTPGGAGLIRSPGAADPNHGSATGRAGGTVHPAAHQSVSRRDDQKDQSQRRPNHLAEEEETWVGGRRRSIPPVVD
ncbi:hypothetical protein ABZ759_05410 [Streptomyces sp. NPDC047860]|uniref:DUF4398 domain-containing protein n=1 Tax=Streptomyces sp. NPDC047860 TaxID=3155743 RepID=UPI0033E64C34